MSEREDGAADARTARRLIRHAGVASLATIARADSPAAGFPFATLVLVAADRDGAPLLLLSGLAEHTRNLRAEPRVSLLFDGTAGLADPLEGARLTLLGEAAPAGAPHQRARFLARHPSAARYAGFADFALYRVAPARAHLVAGFGRIGWVEPAELLSDPRMAAALAEAEPGIVAHMNEDHADAVALYARVLLGRGGEGWRLVAIDPEGIDLGNDSESARLDFDAPVGSAAEARATLVSLVKRARAIAAGEAAGYA